MSSLFKVLFNFNAKHKKLAEEWATTREPIVEGVTFYCKYLGSTPVDDPKGEACTAQAIRRIIHTNRQASKKPERVSVKVDLEGVYVSSAISEEPLLEVSIYRISFCSADSHHDHVFAFVATDEQEFCKCHAFLCPKRKIAQAVTISIAQSFNIAYERYKQEKPFVAAQENRERNVSELSLICKVDSSSSVGSSPTWLTPETDSLEASGTSGYESIMLVDLDCNSDLDSSNLKSYDLFQQERRPVNRSWALFDSDEVADRINRLQMKDPQSGRTSPFPWTDHGTAESLGPVLPFPTQTVSWQFNRPLSEGCGTSPWETFKSSSSTSPLAVKKVANFIGCDSVSNTTLISPTRTSQSCF